MGMACGQNRRIGKDWRFRKRPSVAPVCQRIATKRLRDTTLLFGAWHGHGMWAKPQNRQRLEIQETAECCAGMSADCHKATPSASPPWRYPCLRTYRLHPGAEA